MNKILPMLAALLVFTPGRAAQNAADPVAVELDRMWRAIEARPANQGSRDLFAFALEAVAAGWHPEHVAAVLAQAEELQDRDPASPTRGNFRWIREQPKPRDRNAVEFCMQKAVLVWSLHRQALTPAARAALERMMRESVAGLRAHRVGVDYTNIFLMKTWNCLALGEALGDAGLVAEGTRMFDEWFDDVRANGIGEYLSTNYYGVDCDNLALLRRFAPTPALRQKADTALRLIYAQSAANWFAPSRRLGGAHSRDYDYLTGHGGFDRHLGAWGWMPEEKPVLPALADLVRWVPEQPLAPLPLPRFVWQRWGEGTGRHAATYVGRNFCLGSAGAPKSSDDKTLTIQFPGNPHTVMGNLVIDGRGDPYGHSKEPDKNGHAKALHLIAFVASVQDGADVLWAGLFDPALRVNGRDPSPTDRLATSLVLPAEAEVWSGGSRVTPVEGGSVELAGDRPVFIRVRDVVVAMSVLAATDCAGRPVAARYVRDGTALHAARIAWEQSPGPAAGEAHVILRLRAGEEIDDAAFAALRATFGREPADVHVGGGTLEAHVTRDGQPPLLIKANLQTGEREISPAPRAKDFITVNGRSLLGIAGIEL